ncbi:hypothetical protein MNBD_ALPHA12-2205 [hydrothermal vent metagenome]|uniref:Histidine phosphotransferase ChpT C-terminal domain-containing protein n=1 Tax=hydrothermal vent metagenome TaxID=652676 RepID=A0A3B0TK98_9ZZZZ
MKDIIELSAPDLAAMLCSRVCHDLINPVGAIGNGLEALDDPAQKEMADMAHDLIKNAAKQSLAKLEFARLAYGASSMAGTQFDTRECGRVAELLFDIEKADLDWRIDPVMVPKNKGKLLMNMLIIAAGSVPRGGIVTVEMRGETGREIIDIKAMGTLEKKHKTLIPAGVEDLIAGNPHDGVDARSIQPFYCGLLARMVDMKVKVTLEDGVFHFTATPN